MTRSARYQHAKPASRNEGDGMPTRTPHLQCGVKLKRGLHNRIRDLRVCGGSPSVSQRCNCSVILSVACGINLSQRTKTSLSCIEWNCLFMLMANTLTLDSSKLLNSRTIIIHPFRYRSLWQLYRYRNPYQSQVSRRLLRTQIFRQQISCKIPLPLHRTLLTQ